MSKLTSFPKDFFVIAGPCVLEDTTAPLIVATALAEWSVKMGIPVIFKASFDKANRARLAAPRGPGLERGLAQLTFLKNQCGLPILTDVHGVEQVKPAAEVCDVLQVPAFLCRQTDLLQAVGGQHCIVNIKKGPWMAPMEMRGAVEKVMAYGTPVAVTERGTSFGYGDLVVDMRSIPRLKALGVPVIFDGTHSVQRPGMGPDGASAAFREYTRPLVLAAVAAGADGVYLEVHPDPASSPSDSTSILPLEEFPRLLEDALTINAVVGG